MSFDCVSCSSVLSFETLVSYVYMIGLSAVLSTSFVFVMIRVLLINLGLLLHNTL